MKGFLPIAVVVSVLSGLIYLVGQQNLRLGANDPQIQMAEDLAEGLAAGKKVEDVVEKKEIEISTSLATYIVVFDEEGKILRSQALLDGKEITIPKGILSYTKAFSENRVTWQPRAGVRSAVVVARYNSGKSIGFVMVGRSLREVEKREGLLLIQVLIGWGVAMAATGLLYIGMGDGRKR